MIYTNGGGVVVSCDCKCGKAIFINKSNFFKEYYIYTGVYCFDVLQMSFLDKLKFRLKMIWNILKYGEHNLHELMLNEYQLKELIEALNEIKSL